MQNNTGKNDITRRKMLKYSGTAVAAGPQAVRAVAKITKTTKIGRTNLLVRIILHFSF